MNITVILCTYNRCQVLEKALESVAASTVPGSIQWEVLVVDNNSSDETRSVVEDFCNRYPGRFRYLFEPKQGKSYALNSGVREALGNVLAFMDDDVFVEAEWLQNLTAALQDGEWAGTGGRTVPTQTVQVPGLAVDAMARIPWWVSFTQLHLGDHPCELHRAPQNTRSQHGVSIRRCLRSMGGFARIRGPSPNSPVPVPHQDTEFGCRLDWQQAQGCVTNRSPLPITQS